MALEIYGRGTYLKESSNNEIEGVKTVTVGDLNQKATSGRLRAQSRPMGREPLANIEVTDEYRQVVKLIESDCPVIFVTGKAGTGKSTLISYLREIIDRKLAVVAPTGVAALQARGATIHSFFKFPPRVVTDEEIRRVKRGKMYAALELLIIDEISMVRADVVDAIDKFLRMNGRFPNKPFGGVKILMVGDLLQLPPVITQNEVTILADRNYTTPYFFSAKCLQQCQMASIELTKIFRQTDAEFTEILNKIRVADELEEVVPRINALCSGRNADQGSRVTLTCTNAAADAINTNSLEALPGPEKVYLGEITGSIAVQEDKLPSPMSLTLKKDAQVMFTRNDEQKRWVNGSLGVVRHMDSDSIRVELVARRGIATYDVSPVEWETYRYVYEEGTNKIVPTVVGTYKQFPLMLAWAVTIHKSQGKTLDRVEVDLGRGAFAPGQVYVALSRCRSVQGLTLTRPIRPNDVKCDEVIKSFYRGLE